MVLTVDCIIGTEWQISLIVLLFHVLLQKASDPEEQVVSDVTVAILTVLEDEVQLM